ncbi:hypothetical protein HN014_02985 [Aquimarina sp. TRL1]|uniref:hypothetical protein n=1 Tax=Aquimarina sp. (strain TRL1) TaxID=2736252 RepID=UPI00158F58FE|nr:hypothetical protein [Aquimarina sp. TRL1]QKX03912.1 hypothetical protein HN014_02985 [Aquimarina sp. TRL1]
MGEFILFNTSVKSYQRKVFSGTSIQLSRHWELMTNDTYTIIEYNDVKVILLGDFIDSIENLKDMEDHAIPRCRGNFYAIVIRGERLSLYSSFLSILPIFYHKDKTIFSSSISWIQKWKNTEYTIDKKYILECLLFNYGFFNRTLYQEIHLLPCHTFLTFQENSVSVIKHFETRRLFTSFPNEGSKVAGTLSDLFINTVKTYFPDDFFNIAFTSGFDGRTLVSCATHLNKNFRTFSFGKIENDDVRIPMLNAEELGIPYHYFDLGTEDYYNNKYYANAQKYLSSGYQGNGFLYAHFLYSARQVSKESRYLISGVIGSELFRALHTTGAVTSHALADVFRIEREQELIERLRNSPVLEVLVKNEFLMELKELLEEIIAYKKGLPKELSVNQQFYSFVFEETFRKFFGQWIVAQQQYLTVRTPFLDFNFIRELLQSQYAGANNDFFTNNPLKRMKGQYLYADIIKKTNETIYHQMTGKGYRPIDVREMRYHHNIMIPFLTKRLKRKVTKTNLDNLGIISGIKSNQQALYKTLSDVPYFNLAKIEKQLTELSPYTVEKERDALLMSLSLVHNIQSVKKKKEKEYV